MAFRRDSAAAQKSVSEVRERTIEWDMFGGFFGVEVHVERGGDHGEGQKPLHPLLEPVPSKGVASLSVWKVVGTDGGGGR